ncbi:MAG: hypothetical protein R3F62_31100 [Planctomycetota bacterium]
MHDHDPPTVSAQGLNRCPYCHDGIEIEAEGWLACGRCLSRHHPGCWSEGEGCASCGHESSLARSAALDAGPPRPLAERQLEAYAAFGGDPSPSAGWVVDALTLGLASAFRAERTFLEHKQANQAQEPPFAEVERPDLKVKLYKVHARAFGVTPADTARKALLWVTALLPVLLLLVTVNCWVLGLIDEDAWNLTAFGVFCAFPLLLTAHLHALRGAWVRHERGQQQARLVTRGAPTATVERLRAASEAAWALTGRQHLALTLLGACPGLNLLLPFVVPMALRRTEEQHKEHEASLEAECPRVEPRSSRRERERPAPPLKVHPRERA